MIKAWGYAARGSKTPLRPFKFERREPGPKDVVLDILYCGICHSDIHQARNEWGISEFPMVPGHEIVGRVLRTGARVRRFRAGDIAGVGCFVDSCRHCVNCREGLEQYCENHISWTYSGTEQDKRTRTYGGYSSCIVTDENYVLRIPRNLKPAAAAPLLCAGITTYSPLRHFGVRRGQKAGIVGLGGLGHMGVKLAASMGAEVTVFSTSPEKARDAKRLGAKHFVLTTNKSNLAPLAGRYDFILDTVAAPHDYSTYLDLLRRDGTMALVGVPDKPAKVEAFSLILKRRKLAGSLIGGIRETQEMLDYCGRKGIVSDVEVIPIRKVNQAYQRTIKGDVRYRFVIDLKAR